MMTITCATQGKVNLDKKKRFKSFLPIIESMLYCRNDIGY